MLFCKVFHNEELILEFPIQHFSERLSVSEGKILSCIFNVEDENKNNIDFYQPLIDGNISAIQFFDDDAMIIEYNNYKNATTVQVDYNNLKLNGTILFYDNKGE